MTGLIIILVIVLFIALYPVIRDALKRRKILMPAYTEGLTLLLEGKKELALEKFKQAVTQDSENIDAYLRLAELYFDSGAIERAIKILETLTLRRTLDKSQEKKIYQSLGQIYLKTERFAKALPIFEELVRIDEKDLTNFEILLRLYQKTERWDESERLLKKLASKPKDKKHLSYYYAELGKAVLASQKDVQRALDYYKIALRYDSTSVPALIYQGDYYYANGEIEKAIENWKTVLSHNPQHFPLIQKRLETAYYDLGMYEEVIEVYENLIKKLPEDPNLYIALAKIYEKKEDLKQATAVLARAPVKGLNTLLAQMNLVLLELKQGAVKKSEWVLQQLIQQLDTQTENYRCRNCGYLSKQFEWQCPRCFAWETMKKQGIVATD
ncbi:MAG: tetratricopeptide repeat protein [candidate division WOR-3 bacterium]